MKAACDLAGVAALESRDVGVAFERRHRDVPEDFLASAVREQVLTKRETVVVAGNEADEHYGFGAVVEESMQRFEGAFAVVRKKMIAEF